MENTVIIKFSDNTKEYPLSFYVTHKRKKYKFDAITGGFISPLTGETICTPGFPVSNIISMDECKQICLEAAKILFHHTEIYAEKRI